ncbi:MAG: hypothetical protein SFU27_06105 [Thermonemataceae bacterium]|nr:hypothetical protein [Thermonemataceae bacterium]
MKTFILLFLWLPMLSWGQDASNQLQEIDATNYPKASREEIFKRRLYLQNINKNDKIAYLYEGKEISKNLFFKELEKESKAKKFFIIKDPALIREKGFVATNTLFVLE